MPIDTPAGRLPLVADYLQDARRDPAGFLKIHTTPFLIVTIPGRDEVSTGMPLAGRTLKRIEGGVKPTVLDLGKGRLALAVRKHKSPGTDAVLIGRSRENDLVLPFESVSRLHGFLRFSREGKWNVEDAGSTNGTFVGDRKLKPGVREPVRDGDPLRFGWVQCVFRSAESFVTELTSMPPST